MIYRSPYDGILSVTTDVEKLKTELRKVISDNREDFSEMRIPGECKSYIVTGFDSTEGNIPLFTHPVVVDSGNETYVCSDFRPVLRKAEAPIENIEKYVINSREFVFMRDRHTLTASWVDDTNELFTMNKYSGNVFVRLISSAISFSYGLDMDASLKLRIVAHQYWRSLFKTLVDSEYHTRGLYQIARDLPLRAPVVIEFGNSLKKNIDSLTDLTDNIKLCSPVLDTVTPELLVSLVSKGWFGLDAAGIMTASIIHPPTWTAVLKKAVTNTTYKNTMVAKAAKSLRKPKNEKEWLKEMNELA